MTGTRLSASPRTLAIGLAVVGLAAFLPRAAEAASLPNREFGPLVDGYARYDGQRTCDPTAKPGVRSFRNLVVKRFPWRGYGGIGRKCSIGGRSEHKEGRAWDWPMNVSQRRDRRAVNKVLTWLTATDVHGNPNALARRFGVMYIIWNRRMWSSWTGTWETYCVKTPRGCVDEDGDVKHPHRDHVHFSFSWPGARKQTTWWNRELSYPAPEPTPTTSPSP